MPRTVTVALPAASATTLVDELRELPGLLTLRRQTGVSILPPGDVVTVEVTDRAMPSLMRILDTYGAGAEEGISLTMNEPLGMVSAGAAAAIRNDAASASFEEMEFMLQRESTMDLHKVLVMAIAGVIAVVGIMSDALHIVLGAMLIAPGFEPMIKVSLGLAANSPVWIDGIRDTVKGYGTLIAAAAATRLAAPVLGLDGPAGANGYLADGALLAYWQQLSVTGTVVTVAAGVGGTLLIAATRPLLTAGVMLALALVPSASLMGMGLADGDLTLVGQGLVRWGHDVVLVFLVGLLVLAGKRWARGRSLGQ